MAKRTIKQGSTDQTIDVFIQDASSPHGGGLTGLVYNSAGLTCYYREGATATATALTLATQTVGGAHTDGGFVEISSANMPGWYRVDLSDTIISGTNLYVGICFKGATNMAPCNVELELVAFDPFDGVRLGLTAMPNAAADAAGGLPISDAGGLDLDGMNTNINDIETDTGTTLPATLTTIEGKIDTVDTNVDAILVDTAEIGVAGAGLTDLGGMSTGMKAEVNTEADTALTDYDAPTKTEMDSAFTEIKGATWASGTDTLEHIRNKQTDIETDTAEIGTAGAGLTDLGGMSTAMKAEVNVEADTALTDYDAPTRTEATADKDAIITEVNANETKIDTVDGVVDAIKLETDKLTLGDAGVGVAGSIIEEIENRATPAQVNTECDTALTDYDPPTRTEATADKDAIITEVNANETKIDTIDGNVDSILTDTSDMQPKLGTGIDLGDGTTLANMLTSLGGKTAGAGSYDRTTDSQEAISDNASGAGLTSQQVRDAMKLAPTVGAPSIGSVDEHLDDILTDTGTTLPATLTTIEGKVDTVDTNVDSVLVDTGTTLPATLTDMAGATFVTGTDSLEAIRNRGDAAWTTGAGGGGDATEAKQDTIITHLTDVKGTGFAKDTHSLTDIEAYVDDIPGDTQSGLTSQGYTTARAPYLDELAAANVPADIDTLKTRVPDTISLANINAEADTALTDYDPPTRTEATADKDAIITEVNANETKIDTIDTNVDAVLVDTGTTLPATLGTLSTQASVNTVDSNVDAIKAKTDNLPSGIKKNEILDNFQFPMVDSIDDISYKTGLTVTATRALDDGAFAACTNSVSEISNGFYRINLSAADLNGDIVTLRFTAAGANDSTFTIKLES